MNTFLFKLILMFAVDGIWILLVTVLVEKYGTKSGGVISGIPSTTAITLFFIGWTHTPTFASQTTTLIFAMAVAAMTVAGDNFCPGIFSTC